MLGVVSVSDLRKCSSCGKSVKELEGLVTGYVKLALAFYHTRFAQEQSIGIDWRNWKERCVCSPCPCMSVGLTQGIQFCTDGGPSAKHKHLYQLRWFSSGLTRNMRLQLIKQTKKRSHSVASASGARAYHFATTPWSKCIPPRLLSVWRLTPPHLGV